jgi:hypothetical protein
MDDKKEQQSEESRIESSVLNKPTHRILYTSGLLSRLGFDPSNLLLDHLIFLPKIS